MAGGFFGLGRQVDQRIARYIELVATGGGGGAGAHASGHIDGGSDPIDGDKLEVSWSPTNYTPDTSPSEVDSVDDLTAHLKALDVLIASVLLRGTSFPVGPSDGDLYYHTGHGHLYEFSSTTSTWLGPEQQLVFGMAGTGHNNKYIRNPDGLGSSARGYQIPYDTYITAWTGNWQTTVTFGNFRIRRAGTNTVAHQPAVVGETNFEEYPITPVAFAGSSSMQIYLDNLSASIGHPTIIVYYRRSET